MTTPDVIALTQALVRADTVNPPGHEDQCSLMLADLLQAAGYHCSLVEFAPRRTSLVARLGGRPDRPPLCFTGHVDVVPLGAAPWQHDPFGGEIVDGRLYGRGSSDMKGGVAAFTCAAIALADQVREGPGLCLVITAGEETGCEGAYHLAGSEAGRALLGSAGALVVGEPTGNAPLLGHKGAFWLSASLSASSTRALLSSTNLSVSASSSGSRFSKKRECDTSFSCSPAASAGTPSPGASCAPRCTPADATCSATASSSAYLRIASQHFCTAARSSISNT